MSPHFGATPTHVHLLSAQRTIGQIDLNRVFVQDIQGMHRDEYFYTTDTSFTGTQIASWFTVRWPIETTFQEVRAHLDFETPRQYVAKSVLRAAPCLLGLFSGVCLIFAEHTRRHRVRVLRTQWYIKAEPIFSDAIATVRRLFWQKTVFAKDCFCKGFVSSGFRKIMAEIQEPAAELPESGSVTIQMAKVALGTLHI